MITSSVVRFARTASVSAPTLHSATTSYLASSSLSSQLSYQTRKAHQRRNSSSKASAPPNGSSSPSRVRRSSADTPSSETTSSAAGRGVRGRKPKAPSVEGAFSHLPSVPSTDHLHVADVYASSFFSLHRPISVTSVFPAKTTFESFAKIFAPSRIASKHEPSEVIKTLGSAIEDFEGAQAAQEEFIDEAGNSIQNAHEFPLRTATPRDLPMTKFDQFRPYAPPPPPEAQGSDPASSAKTSRRASKKEPTSTTRSWQATINVTEETTASGQKIYTARPMSAMVMNVYENDTELDGQQQISTSSPTIIQQPFLERMRSRQQTWHAISVKRQRKLKMKKHKYKKLMKRTRNERRRLGKI